LPHERQARPESGQDSGLFNLFSYEGGFDMDSTTIIRIAAGVLFVIVLVILIQRRRTRIK